jgi:DNA-binding transcriptional regulator LsrR (DeoR family)
MSRIVLLDSGPLGRVSNPRASAENRRCQAWAKSLRAKSLMLRVPEIADYEVRRELLRAKRGLVDPVRQRYPQR